MTSNVESNVSFLSLPPELRDLIYAEYWKVAGPLQIIHNALAFQVRYQRSAKPILTLPGPVKEKWSDLIHPLCLANKTIQCEAYQALARRSAWRLLGDWRQFCPSSGRYMMANHLVFFGDRYFKSFDPSQAQSLDFSITMTNVSEVGLHPDRRDETYIGSLSTTIVSMYDPERRLEGLFDRLEADVSKVQHLSLTLSFQIAEERAAFGPNHPFSFNFEALRKLASALPNLITVRINVAMCLNTCYMDLRVKSFASEHQEDILESVGCAVKDLGGSLLGEDAQRKCKVSTSRITQVFKLERSNGD